MRLWKSFRPGTPTTVCPPIGPLLTGLPRLRSADAAVVASLERAFEVRSFAEGEILFLEQEPGDAAWLLAEGTVDVLRQVRGTRAERLAQLKAGDLFGVNAIIASGPRTASCVAVTPGWAYRLPGAASAALTGEAHLLWNECVLAVLQAQLRLASGTLGRAIGRPVPLVPKTAGTPASGRDLEALLRQSGFLEGLPAGLDLDSVELVIDEDTLRNPRRRSAGMSVS